MSFWRCSSELTQAALTVCAGVDSDLRTRLSCKHSASLPDCKKAMDAFDEKQQAFNGSPLDDENVLSGQFWGELRVFLAVAKTKSFNRAAEITKTSQPTVSRQVKRLQDVVGSQLFIATARGAS